MEAFNRQFYQLACNYFVKGSDFEVEDGYENESERE